MKITLEKLQEMDESKLPDSDHPFKQDITGDEFRDLLNQIAEKTKNIKPLNPITDEEWQAKQDAILAAMNSHENPY